jgi:hypothetical protein
MVAKKQSVYADKFFGKMKPGMMGDGFVGLVVDENKKKAPKPLFPTLDELTER